jgi:uncharacterized repeat protein (TIGR01451 family)
MNGFRTRTALAACGLSFLTILAAAGVQAATLTVVNNFDSGAGSLRQAIIDANGTAGTDTIVFAIPGAGLHTIAPVTALPPITEAVVIDGYSQAGASVNTLALGDNAVLQIELTGTGVSNGIGLSFGVGVTGGEVRGLLMTHWNNAIQLSGTTNLVMDGNFFGTNAAGTAASSLTANGNGLFILNSASNNTVGGAANAARNLISGNTTAGITMGNSGTLNNVIQNNYIGTNAAGTGALPNDQGLSFNGLDATTVRGNVISGNNISPTFSAGIAVYNGSNHIVIVGNRIGTTADGLSALPNAYGISFSDGFSGGATSNTIGTLAEPNTIAFNASTGVAFLAGLAKTSRLNSIRYNSIYSNGKLGIDFGDDGITANDAGDGDTGLFNDLQNYPVLTSAQFGAGTITIAGTLNSMPSSPYNLQFFQSVACDPSGAGEGQTFLGETMVLTDGSGTGAFNVNVPGTASGVVTAIATDSLGNTSEFSLCQAITTPAQPQISISDAQVIEGNAGTTPLTFNVTLSAASASTVTVGWGTADQTATAGSDYAATGGTVTFTPGQTSKPVTVTVQGDVTPEADETMLVNLNTPVNATILDGQGVGTIRNDDNLSALSINDVTLAEGNSGTTSFTFTVTLTPAAAFPVTVNYATADGTAIGGNDYQPASGALTFAPGQTTKSITVLVNGDVTTEPNETFFVNLFNPGNASISDNQGLGTITNDDANPSITINDPSVVEGNAGSKSMQFVITMSNPSSSTINVPFTLADGTANVGSDYQTNSGSFTVIPGALTASLFIGINGDTTVEPDETFFVNLGATAGATIAKPQGTGTIINDDGLALPGISISDVTLAEGNSGTTSFNFTVSLTASSASTVTVNYTTADGSATAPSDYAAKSGVVTFTPGQTSQVVTILVNGDTVFEPNETFFVNLTAPSNATIIDAQGQGTINNDDVVGSADMSILETGAASAGTNTNVVYTITATNNGPTSATGAAVTEVLPAGTVFVSAQPSQGSCSGTTTVICTLGSLNSGNSATVTLTIKMPVAAGLVTNTATVTAAQNDPTPGNNSSSAPTTVTVAAPPPAVAPALSTWLLLLLAALLGGVAVVRMG